MGEEGIILEKEELSDLLIEELNELVIRLIERKKKEKIQYDFIEQILLSYLEKYNYSYPFITIEKVKPIKKWEIIALAMDFFKSINPEIYKKIKEVIFNTSSNTRINIYNLSEINDLSEPDFEYKHISKYSESSDNACINNKSIVHIPIQYGLDYNIKFDDALGKDTATLTDAYIIVHELTHTIDMYMEYFFNKDEVDISRILNKSYVTTESIAIGFEMYFTEYLLKKGIINSPFDVKDIVLFRDKDTKNKCMESYTRLMLIKIMEKKKIITREDIKDIANALHYNLKQMISFSNIILSKGEDSLFLDLGYAISGMISPTIKKMIHNGETDRINECIKKSQINDLEGVLNALGISRDKNGLNQLYKNKKEMMYDFEIISDKEEQR